MQIEFGEALRYADGREAEVVDFVVDPVERRLTHLVVRYGHADPTRLVPLALLVPDGDGGLALDCGEETMESLPTPQAFAIVTPGELPVGGPTWDVGVEQAVPVPTIGLGALDDEGFDTAVGLTYDRVPKGMVELRRGSACEDPDGEPVGSLHGVRIGGEGRITHVLVGHGHLWWRRLAVVPVDDVETLLTDALRIRLTRAEADALAGAR